jgi:hypothetical protein
MTTLIENDLPVAAVVLVIAAEYSKRFSRPLR